MLRERTIIYYTSNREKPEFERRIMQTLMENSGGMPIVSVSQKPINLGTNICVGEVGVSNYNAFRQMQIAAQAARTEFVCTAESDYLYPPEYFRNRDLELNMTYPVYRNYMIYENEYYYSQRVNEGCMLAGREYLIQALEEMLLGSGKKTTWHEEIQLPSLFINKNRHRITLRTPIITFKTPENMHKKHHKRSYVKVDDVQSLPYWGTAKELSEKYYAE